MDTSTLLKKHNLRKTAFRTEVLNLFLEKKGHAFAQSDIEEQLIDPDRITLYRTLRSFEEKGLIHQAYDSSGVNKYALCNDNCNEHSHEDSHAHFHCQTCGITQCLHESVSKLNLAVPNGYAVYTTDVVVTGICGNCNQSN